MKLVWYKKFHYFIIRGTVHADMVEGIAPEYTAMIRRTTSEEDAEVLLKEHFTSILV